MLFLRMKKMHYTEVESQIPKEEGVKDTTVRWLIQKDDGADNFAMRLFTVEPGGETPYHQHDWEHEVFQVEGEGVVVTEDGEHPFKPGEFVFVPSMEWHQFRNPGAGPLKFLCLVPYKD